MQEVKQEDYSEAESFAVNDNREKKSLTGVERFFDSDEIIVSKTDLTGRITYVNDVFMRIGGYDEDELLGVQHSIIRHPDMPRCIFKFMWETLGEGKEIFAYVNNRAKNGDNYWVFAHVTPSFNDEGKIIAYHSSRRVPKLEIVKNTIAPLYKQLLEAEQSEKNRKVGLEKSSAIFNEFLKTQGVEYEKFILSL